MKSNPTGRLLRLKEVSTLVGLKKTTLYSRIKTGDFPRPIDLGGNRIAFVESEIQGWIDARIAASRPNVAA